MLTVFGDIFVTRKCFYCYIFVRINEVTNNEIIVFFNFFFQDFTSLITLVQGSTNRQVRGPTGPNQSEIFEILVVL